MNVNILLHNSREKQNGTRQDQAKQGKTCLTFLVLQKGRHQAMKTED